MGVTQKCTWLARAGMTSVCRTSAVSSICLSCAFSGWFTKKDGSRFRMIGVAVGLSNFLQILVPFRLTMRANYAWSPKKFHSNHSRWNNGTSLSEWAFDHFKWWVFQWAKPVATELFFIRMSRPLAAKPAANRVMKNCLTWCKLGVDTCFGLIWASLVHPKLALNLLRINN